MRQAKILYFLLLALIAHQEAALAAEAISTQSEVSLISEWDPKSNPEPKAIDGKTAPSHTLLFVDALGNVEPTLDGAGIRTEWTWLPRPQGGSAPVLRVWVKFPDGTEIIPSSAQTLRSSDGEWAYDHVPGDGPISLKWKNSKGILAESSGIVNIKYPFVWMHENCVKNHVQVGFLNSKGIASNRGRGMVVVYCDDPSLQGNVEAYIHLFGEFQFEGTAPASPEPRQKCWEIVRKTQHENQSPAAILLGGFTLQNLSSKTEGKKSTPPLGIFRQTKVQNKSVVIWRGSAAAQVSSLNYLEGSYSGSIRAKSNQWGLTLKSGLDWSRDVDMRSDLSELDRWNFGASIFGTTVTFQASQSGPVISTGNEGASGAPRFLGINLRAGRRLNSWGSPWDLRTSAGFYYWGMTQSSRDFGLDYLLGPQLVLSLRRNQPLARGYGGYIKLARTGTGFGLGLDEGRELAVGGEVQLNSPGSKFRINGLIDIANTSLDAEESDRQMSLDSISIGVGIVF